MERYIYELSQCGASLGYFDTEAEAIHHARYMPSGLYEVRQWQDRGDTLYFDARRNSRRIVRNNPERA